VKPRSLRPFGRLEPDEGKLSCPVLRGGKDGNILSLPDQGIRHKKIKTSNRNKNGSDVA